MKTIAPGERIGAYNVVRLLGKGGMGCVYEVEHPWKTRNSPTRLTHLSYHRENQK